MARYDWPGPAPADDAPFVPTDHYYRLWRSVAPGFADRIAQDFNARLAAVAGLTDAQVDSRRWLPLGPSAVIGAAGSDPVASGGCVRDVQVSPDGKRVYAASPGGGVWYSGDAGRTWSPLGGMATVPDPAAAARSPASPVVAALHVEFGADAGADVVYAGTGEPPPHPVLLGTPSSGTGGVGILKLTSSVPATLAAPNGSHWTREAPNLAGAGTYRLARNPAAADHMIAATSIGLFERKGAFSANGPWAEVRVATSTRPGDQRLAVTDVAWVPPSTSPATPARLFVTLVQLGKGEISSGLYVSEAGTAGPFTRIDLPDQATRRRFALAAAMPAAAGGNHPQILYVLSSGGPDNALLWRIDGGGPARKVAKVPPLLFAGERMVDGARRKTVDDSWYDMALAIDPSDPATLFLGGGAEAGPDGWIAALYRCRLAGTAAADDFTLDYSLEPGESPRSDPSFRGDGVPANVHSIRVSPDGRTAWIGGNGGLFVSERLDIPGSFVSRGDGLAILECGFAASHPASPAPLLASAHGTGVLRRIGDVLWQRLPLGGDGGGLAFHPDAGSAAHFVAQHRRASWNGLGHFDPPVIRPGMTESRFAPEALRSLNYMSPAAKPGSAAGKARLAIGTHRLWLSDEWDPKAPPAARMAWRTLPSGTDPGWAASPDFEIDSADKEVGAIIAARWLVDGSGTADTSRLLALHERAILRFSPKPGGGWESKVLAFFKKKAITENSDIPEHGDPAEELPALAAWPAIAAHRSSKAGDSEFKGSFYVSTMGQSKTGSGGQIVESDRMDGVWWFDGKEQFFPTGFRAGATRAPALALLCDPVDPAILYVGTSLGVWKGVIDETGTKPAWAWSLLGFGLPEAPVHDLSIQGAAGGVRLLRAATRSRGIWELDLSAAPASVGRAFLRVHPLDTRHVLPTPLDDLLSTEAAPAPLSPCFSPDIGIFLEAPRGWASTGPSEADLALAPSLTEESASAAGAIRVQRVVPGAHRGFVLAHFRHVRPSTGIKIALLKLRLAPADGDGRAVALSDAWKDSVVRLVADALGATLDGRWKRASDAVASHPAANPLTVANSIAGPALPVHAARPAAAQFALDLEAAKIGERYLLLAVMSAPEDPLTRAELNGATVGDLVRNARHVCARTIAVESPAAFFPHVLLDHLDSAGTSVVAGTVPATPAAQKTTFYDASKTSTTRDPALQAALDAILAKPVYKKIANDLAVSVVDLAGARKFAPLHASHNDRMNFYAASTGKVTGMLAAYQLLADAQDFLVRTAGIGTMADLAAGMRSEWQARGIRAKDHPDILNVLGQKPGTPFAVDLRPDLLARFADISHGNENGSTAIVLLNFPFIASTLLAHGLFSPADESGLWSRKAYGEISWRDWNAAPTAKPRKRNIAHWGRENPYPDLPSNSVSAAAITQFMVLAAQGRLIDRASSAAMLTHLNTGGCIPGGVDLTPLASGRKSVKCGIFGGNNHMPLHFKHSTTSREFVITLLTRNDRWGTATALFQELLTLV
jgi:hypothetical protein